MAEKKIDRFVRTIPKVYKPEINPVIKALLEAWGQEHDAFVEQADNTKDQLFVKTAEGQYLDRLGSGLGVSRPASLGLIDSDFQKLIPVLSLQAKNIRKTFYEAMDVFWSPLFSRTNIQTTTYAPFNISTGDEIIISVDGGEEQAFKALDGDIATDGAATALEVAAILSRIKGITASVIHDQATDREYINIRTDTPGPRGSLQVSASTMVDGAKLDFNLKKNRITDLSQRTVIWEVRPKELVIELPAIIPTLKRTLRGSHHIHADSTIESPVAPSGGIWQGSFLYQPTGPSYTVTGQKAQILETLTKGNIYTKVTVNDASAIPNAPGSLILGWGRSNEEQPVKYINRPNDSTILLDPGHVFTQTHPVGTYLNVLLPTLKPLTPRTDGSDLGIYLTSPSNARAVVQDLLRDLAAAGVVVTFVVLLPSYKYLVTNPYQGA